MPSPAFEEIFGDASPEVSRIGTKLEQAILDANADSVIVPYPGYKSVNYGFGTKKNSECYAYLMSQKDRVNLGFYYGTQLADPDGLLEGTGANLRHVKVRDEQVAQSAAVADLIHAAVEERRIALGAKPQ